MRKIGLIALAAASITALLYARSLALPFYSDDLVQLPWLRSLSLPALWTQISPYGYYRPLAFSIWLVIRDIGIEWTPAGLRLLNLLGHALAASLVGWLALEIDPERRTIAGVLAAAFFATYPFAYQAVPSASAFFYPLAVILTVGAVIAYLHAREMNDWRWMMASLAATALAPFAHENGMLVGLLVALAEGARQRQRQAQRRPSAWPLAHMAISAICLGWWLAIREEGVATLDLSASGLVQNATILANGWSFPAAWLATFAGEGWRGIAVWGVTIAASAGLWWLMRKAPNVLAFCAEWFLISIGPVLVTMRPEWLIDAPRFLYPAGVGAAIAWGIGLSAGARGLSPLQHPDWVAAIGGLAAMIPGAIFVMQGIEWHQRGGAAIWDAVQAAEAHPGEGLLMFNLPDRLAPLRSMYPYFDGGAILLPPQVPVEQIIGAHMGQAREIDQAATVGVILQSVDYERTTYGAPVEPAEMGNEIAGRAVMVADYAGETIRLREVGRIIEGDRHEQGPIAEFGPALALSEAETSVEEGVLIIRLVWEIRELIEGAPTVFIHVVDAAGEIVAQADGDPMAGLHPLTAWRGAVSLEDSRYVRLPTGARPYTVYVGVWDPSTGERLRPVGGEY